MNVRSAMRAAAYVIRRLVAASVVLILVASLTFLVTRATSDPSYLMAGQDATDEILAARRAELGLDQPIHVQWYRYMQDLVSGDLGVSRRTFEPVSGEILQRLPATIELAMFALLLALLFAIPFGIVGGLRKGGLLDRISGAIAQLGAATPNFWLGLMLLYIGFYWLGWFPPPTGRGFPSPNVPEITGLRTVDAALAMDPAAFMSALRYLVLPALALSSGVAPAILSVVRNATASVAHSAYYEAALSFGIPSGTVLRRVLLPNIAGPVMNVLAITLGFLIGGAVLVEVVFSWPGIGLYAVNAMDVADYNPVIGVVLLSAITYVVVYQLADTIMFIIDPRLRIQR